MEFLEMKHMESEMKKIVEKSQQITNTRSKDQ